MRAMDITQTLVLSLLLVSVGLPDAAADFGSQLRALKQFGGRASTPQHDVL